MSKPVRWLLYSVAGFLLVLLAIAATLVARFQPIARDYVISALKQRYKSDVELGDLRISLFPAVHATADNLVLRFGGRADLPPMVRIRRLTLDAGFVGFFRSPKRISRLKLEGLEITTPPKSAGRARHTEGGGRLSEPGAIFVLDEVDADSAVLSTTPSDPQPSGPSKRDPLVFRIHQLTMHSVGIGLPMTFHAKVENPKPHGLIDSEGNFGPWNSSQPGDTPLSGRYTFRDADLGVFKGIAGTLSSDGQYGGELGRLEVHGKASVPNFSLDTAGHPMQLDTEFDATVDGTNGDTVLHPVHAHLGKSWFDVTGSIARNALETHKVIQLDAQCGGGRLEDFLKLAVKGTNTPMTGRIAFSTKVKIPPGQTPVADRVELDGNFSLNGVRFTDAGVQGKIAGLSHRAQGDPNDHDPNVSAEFSGIFQLKNGYLSLPNLRFELPGAHLTMAGGYGLRSGAIDLDGTVRLDAKVSQMTTGFKSLLLRPVDRFFARDGAGTVLPIGIRGTRGKPEFVLDIGRMLKRK